MPKLLDADSYLMRLLTRKVNRHIAAVKVNRPLLATELERKRYAEGFLAGLHYASEQAIENGTCGCDGAPDGTGLCPIHDAVHLVQNRLCVSGVYKHGGAS